MMPRSGFLSRPRLAGWLAIGNMTGWLLLVLLAYAAPLPRPVVYALGLTALILSLPLGLWAVFLLGAFLGNNYDSANVVFAVTLLGINSLIWGRLLSRIIRRPILFDPRTTLPCESLLDRSFPIDPSCNRVV